MLVGSSFGMGPAGTKLLAAVKLKAMASRPLLIARKVTAPPSGLFRSTINVRRSSQTFSDLNNGDDFFDSMFGEPRDRTLSPRVRFVRSPTCHLPNGCSRNQGMGSADGDFPAANAKIAGFRSPSAIHMTTPTMMGKNHASPTRRCVQTAPPRYPVTRIAPRKEVLGIRNRIVTAISRTPRIGESSAVMPK